MRLAFAILLGGVALPAAADAPQPPPPQQTHIEFGIGLGAVDFPAYEGAAEKRQLALPFPYFTIRSRFLDANRDQVRGKLLRGGDWSLDMDFGGNVDVNSADTRERQGMPDLDWLLEAGPALRYHAWEGEAEDGVDFVLPARVSVSARALAFHHRGFDSDPRLEWHATWFQTGEDRVIVDANVAGRFVDRGYADYYYSVAPQYATPTRPAYAAPGGYAGWSAQVGVSWHRGDMVYGAFIEHTSLHGAAFQSSPLVGDAGGWSFGMAVSWILQRR